MKVLIDIKGVITKNDLSEISQKEYDEVIDTVLEAISNKGYGFGGGFGHFTEEEYEKLDDKLSYCNRVNMFDNNRCINCGAKAGQKCELKN